MLLISNEDKVKLLRSYRKIDVENALMHNLDDIYKIRDINHGYAISSYYQVMDQTVKFMQYKSGGSRLSCDCHQFYIFDRCQHTCLYELVNIYNAKELSKDELMHNFILDFITKKEKETLNLTPIIYFDKFHKGTKVKIKLGLSKQYMSANKIFELISNLDSEVYFGKDFTYDPSVHCFNKVDEQIINFIKDWHDTQNSYSKDIILNNIELEQFLNILNDKTYLIEGVGKTKGFVKGNPLCLDIRKEEDIVFDFKEIDFLDFENRYVFDKQLYQVNSNVSKIYSQIKKTNLSKIVLKEQDALLFSKKIYNDFILNVSEDLKSKFVITKPKVKLYFDMLDKISCKVIFEYEKEINYFDKTDFNRDEEFESEVINDLYDLKFVKDKKTFLINNVNDMVYFIEEGIINLNKYEIYTTKNVNKSSIVKPSIKSNFSIGKDNIMNYSFDLGQIEDKEIDKIFKSIKSKEKYYKLKNGNILNTENNNLIELMEVMDYLDVEETNGVIPKYRALYLDSVKEYSIINTDNLFNQFIDNFNKYKNSDVILSKKDDSILREYQKDGVKWLYNIYKSGFGGVLADEMGLGKTIQTIMFLKNVLRDKNCKILIVCPTSLIYNWEKEFDMFAPSLKYKVIDNTKEKREDLINQDFNIFITSYGRLRNDVDIYNDKCFELIIIDEAQNIKNPKAGISKALKQLKAETKIALTGTPVENSVLEVWSIFDFIMPGFLHSLSKFQSKYNVKEMNEKSHKLLSELSNVISPFILRRRKNEVLKELPIKQDNNIYLELPEKQKKLYAFQVKKSKKEFEELLEKEGFLKARFKILQLLTKLRQICIDPNLIFEDYDGESIKLSETIDLLNGYIKNGHKVLIFSSFKSAIYNLSYQLKENNITHYIIDGSVSSKKRTDLVDAFNKDNTNVFLITLKAGGTGLNLTSADVVIHLDLWWNPAVENQATDRAHRIGQINNVEVVKLICKGTIEEKILDLQNKKKVLNDSLIDNDDKDNTIMSSLNETDIKNLLSNLE
ncbi:MAG: SNF2-related protein [Mycoplasmatota bacterium]